MEIRALLFVTNQKLVIYHLTFVIYYLKTFGILRYSRPAQPQVLNDNCKCQMMYDQ